MNGLLTKGSIAAGSTAVAATLGTAIYGIIMGYPGLVGKVNAQETEIEALKDSQETLAKNQRVIDEAVRDLKADSEWSQQKLDAMMESLGITKRIPRPKLKPSELEEVE